MLNIWLWLYWTDITLPRRKPRENNKVMALNHKDTVLVKENLCSQYSTNWLGGSSWKWGEFQCMSGLALSAYLIDIGSSWSELMYEAHQVFPWFWTTLKCPALLSFLFVAKHFQKGPLYIILLETVDDGVEEGRDNIVEKGCFLTLSRSYQDLGLMYMIMAGP